MSDATENNTENTNISAETIEGSIEQLIFYNDENGFFVTKIKCHHSQEIVTVIGLSPTQLKPRDHLEARGYWFNDPRHGIQFKSTDCKTIPPDTINGIEKYLASGMIAGIGPKLAKRLVKLFGKNIFEIIERKPNRLMELNGIGKKRKELILSSWQEQKTIRDIMIFLQNHGIGTTRAIRIYKYYGDQTLSIIKKNPYQLIKDIRGIGFQIADELALNFNINPYASIRIQAGIKHVLFESTFNGHCALPLETITIKAAELLGVDTDKIQQSINTQIKEKQLITEKLQINNTPYDKFIYLPQLYNAEKGVAYHINRLIKGYSYFEIKNINDAISWAQEKNKINFSKSQKSAIKLACKSKFCVITGGPGVGKTTAINSIIDIIQYNEAKILLCAPTGKAAKRLTESTGREATTIHRLLEFMPDGSKCKYDDSNPLKTDFIVVDETSMVDINLMNFLLRAIPSEASVLLVGDIDQLPSIGPGAVLNDIIDSKHIPVAIMSEVFRQAAESNIITTAHNINDGKTPNISLKGEKSDFFFISATTPQDCLNKLIKVVISRLPVKFKFDPLQDIQILTPMNKGGLGTKSLNEILQKMLNPSKKKGVKRSGVTFNVGDKIIQTINNYDKDIFNGDIGKIINIDHENQILIAKYDQKEVHYNFIDLDEIALAYAITIHKSQGSEYPCVVFPILMQHFRMLERNLLYTGVTRGKKMVVLIGDPKSVTKAINNSKSKYRFTGLKQWINE